MATKDLSRRFGDDHAGGGGGGGDVEGANAPQVSEPDGGGEYSRELFDRVDQPQLEVVGDVACAGVVVDQRSSFAEMDVGADTALPAVLLVGAGPAVRRLE
ncbi:MAG: hypothetical protein ACRELX_17785 [Longimicrobiales bacterium]